MLLLAAILATQTALAAQTANLGDDALRTGAPRYLGVELGAETGSILTDPPATVPHGILRLRYIEKEFIPGPGLVELDLNTDTLSLGYGHPGLLGPRTWAKAYVRGQGFAANLLTDYARGGVQVAERTFGAGYLLAGAQFSATLLQTDQLSIALGAQLEMRQWFHFANGDTSPDLVLPPWNQAAEPTIFVVADASQFQTRLLRRHGLRVWGSATGIGRLGAAPWGAVGDDDDGRNNIGPFGGRAEAGVESGWVGPKLAFLRPVFDGGVRAGVGQGLDDRDRFRVGGDNPWVVPLAGAGWAEFLVDDYAWAGASTGVIIFDVVALDIGTEIVALNDPLRIGARSKIGVMSGGFLRLVARPIDDVILTLRASQGFGLPRPGTDIAFLQSSKIFANVEWRILPWSWW